MLVLLACSRDKVEQIQVTVPGNVKVPPDMVYIPAGEFIMGQAEDSRTEGGHPVSLKAYLIDRHEVTEGQYRSSPSKLPVTHVSFQEAEAYCLKIGKRLPTEQEWEKAARGVKGGKWAWGNYLEHPNNGFSGFTPEEVDKRPEWVSPYGVYGMGYNVWEWVSDGYSFKDMPTEDTGRFKVIRGGLTQSHLTVQFTPTYFRNWMEPEAAHNFLGFRCAKDAEPLNHG